MKRLYDRKTERTVFEPEDQVPVSCLLPSSPFEAKFEGPYVIKHRLSDENYIVATPHRRRSTQFYHVNLLKPFYEKSKSNSENSIHSVLAISDVKNFCSGQELEKEGYELDDSVLLWRLNNTESLEKLDATLVHLSPSVCGTDFFIAEFSRIVWRHAEVERVQKYSTQVKVPLHY